MSKKTLDQSATYCSQVQGVLQKLYNLGFPLISAEKVELLAS